MCIRHCNLLKTRAWDAFIMDEDQALRNKSSKTWKTFHNSLKVSAKGCVILISGMYYMYIIKVYRHCLVQ